MQARATDTTVLIVPWWTVNENASIALQTYDDQKLFSTLPEEPSCSDDCYWGWSQDTKGRLHQNQKL
jgi:hypothetical protein